MTAMGGRANDAATENGRLVSCRFRPEGLSNMWERTETGFLLHLLHRVTRPATTLEVTLLSILMTVLTSCFSLDIRLLGR